MVDDAIADAGIDAVLGRIADRLERRLPALARRAVERFVAATPLYEPEDSPPHVRQLTVYNTQRVLALCLRAVRGRVPDAEVPTTWHVGGMDRVQEGLPIREYMRLWHLGFDVLAEALTDALTDRPAAAATAIARARRMHDHLLREAVTAFELQARNLALESHRQDAAALAALFRGEPWTLRQGIEVPAHPVVVAAEFGPSGPELTSDLSARSAAHLRKVRYARSHLSQSCPGLRLADIRPDSAHLLLEGPLADADAVDLAGTLARALGARVLLAIDDADGPADLPRAHRVATEVLAVGSGAGLVDTALRLSDVAVRMQLSGPGPALDLIRRRCAPVLDRPELATTVREFLAHEFDRRRTAAALVVHPNTVDNRLIRIRELTGLDVHAGVDLLTLAIAVGAPRGETIDPPRSTM